MNYPEMNITINGKDRVKRTQDGKVVYLKNETEFGLELFNPTDTVLVGMIYINGKLISSAGLIVKPGERVFLDRYIDTNDKFKFVSYDVEANNEAVEKAIAKNGVVTVKWYKERAKKTNPIQFIDTTPYHYPLTWTTTNRLFEGDIISTSAANNLTAQTALNSKDSTVTCDGMIDENWVNTITTSEMPTTSACYCSTVSSSTVNGETVTNYSNASYKNGKLVDSDNKTLYKKTGRVATGGKSDQELEYNNDYSFETFVSYINELQILPIENKPLTAKELAERPIYCTNCGKKLHKKYKYCPSCGQKV